MSYTQKEYTEQVLSLFPLGKAFPRAEDTNFYKLIYSMMNQFMAVDNTAEQLPADWFPATTTNFLTEWQKTLGLPDKCVSYQSSFEDQRNQVVSRLTFSGDSTTDFLRLFCKNFGYDVSVTEWGQLITGCQSCGTVSCGPSDFSNESYITIQLLNDKDISLLLCELSPFIPPYINMLFFDKNGVLLKEL